MVKARTGTIEVPGAVGITGRSAAFAAPGKALRKGMH
jgi:hypothetical protein